MDKTQKMYTRAVNEETVTIPKEEYESLLDDQLFLSCLEGAGVDNWDGYEYAREAYDEEKNNDDA